MNHLTNRQIEAVTLCSYGYSNPEIAEELMISDTTVRYLLDAARIRLGAKSVRHMMALAASSGIVTPKVTF